MRLEFNAAKLKDYSFIIGFCSILAVFIYCLSVFMGISL